MQLVHISFLRQFREEEIALPCQDHQYRNMVLRHFSCTKKERRLVDQFLERKLAHSALIGSLIDKMEKEDLNTSKQLSAYAGQMRRQFTAFAHETPHKGRYYQSVSQALALLMETVDICREATRRRVQCLKALVAGKKAAPFHPADFRDIQLVLNQYLDNLSNQHQRLTVLLEQESNGTAKFRLGTRAGLSLAKLLALLQKEISAVGATAEKVEEWRRRLRILIIQETYN